MTDKKLNVFEQLRALNITKHVEKKNGFNYLSWAWALEQMYTFDEDAEFEFPEREVFSDGTVMIYCDVTIKGKIKRGFLPAMDFRNKAIQNPSAREISDNMQRCLVKAIALHGLGLGLYAGEDLPKEVENAKSKQDVVSAKAVGGSMARDLDRDTQETMRDTAVRYLKQCAKVEAIDTYAKKHHNAWKKSLDNDLYEEIVKCGKDCKAAL